MSAFDRLRELFTDKKFVDLHQLWLSDPVTRAVFDAAEELARPRPVSHPAAEHSSYMLGELVGMERILSFARSTDSVLESVSAAEDELEAMYGAKVPEHILAAQRRRERRTKAATAPAA